MAERKFTVTLEMYLDESWNYSSEMIAHAVATEVREGLKIKRMGDCRPIEASWADGRDPGFLRVDAEGAVG